MEVFPINVPIMEWILYAFSSVFDFQKISKLRYQVDDKQEKVFKLQIVTNLFLIFLSGTNSIRLGSIMLEIHTLEERLELLFFLTSPTKIHGPTQSIGKILGFFHIKRYEETKRYGNAKQSVMIVGTKIDLRHKAQVSRKEVEQYCESIGVNCMWISSKEDKNVNEMMYLITHQIFHSLFYIQAAPIPDKSPVQCNIA